MTSSYPGFHLAQWHPPLGTPHWRCVWLDEWAHSRGASPLPRCLAPPRCPRGAWHPPRSMNGPTPRGAWHPPQAHSRDALPRCLAPPTGSSTPVQHSGTGHSGPALRSSLPKCLALRSRHSGHGHSGHGLNACVVDTSVGDPSVRPNDPALLLERVAYRRMNVKRVLTSAG